jgi:hypothetical protein
VQFSLRALLLAIAFLCCVAWLLHHAISMPPTSPAYGTLVGRVEVDSEPFETNVFVARQVIGGPVEFYKAAATEPDGNFTMRLPPGLYDLYVSLAGPDDFRWDRPSFAWQQVSIYAGKATPIRPLTSLQPVASPIRIPFPTVVRDKSEQRQGK